MRFEIILRITRKKSQVRSAYAWIENPHGADASATHVLANHWLHRQVKDDTWLRENFADQLPVIPGLYALSGVVKFLGPRELYTDVRLIKK